MFNLLPKDAVFFDLFEKLAEHVHNGAQHLAELATQFPEVARIIQRIRDEEHAADELTHQTLERLDRTFITPFDREDIHQLAGGLDDIVDAIDALAKRFPMYHVKRLDPSFAKQTQVLVEATTALATAVRQLRTTRKLSEISPAIIEIHRLENAGDDNHQAAVSRLFEGDIETLDVMRWTELYGRIEKAIDKCDVVAHTLERIMLKNG